MVFSVFYRQGAGFIELILTSFIITYTEVSTFPLLVIQNILEEAGDQSWI